MTSSPRSRRDRRQLQRWTSFGETTQPSNQPPASYSHDGRLLRVTSCRERGRFEDVIRGAEASESGVSTPSPSRSPVTQSHSHRPVPSFKAMSESDARLFFRGLVEAFSRSRTCASWQSGDCSNSGGSSSGSILFGSCNQPCCRPLTFFAPEMLQPGATSYDLDRLEIWSLGVLLYQMLTGRQPFAGKSDEQTLRLIQSARVRFPLNFQALTISPQAKRLIRAMLSARPEERISLDQVLRHPWLCPGTRRACAPVLSI